MALDKTITGSLSGYQNVKGGSTINLSATVSGITGKSNDSQAQALANAQANCANAIKNAIYPYNNRSTLKSWGTDGGTTSSTSTLQVGNSYYETKGSATVTSYGTPVYANDIGNLYWECSLNNVTGYCPCTSKKTAYDTNATFSISPSTISSSENPKVTITHTATGADNFAFYIGVVSSATFLSALPSAYVTVTPSTTATSTTVTLTSAMVTAIKNQSGKFILNIGKYYASGGIKSSYAGTVTVSKVTFNYKQSSVTLSYNANGGSGAPSSQTLEPGTAGNVSTTVPTRTGYTFKGWATSSSGSVAYGSGDAITISANTTLYAVWQAKTYTVTYNANGGSFNDGVSSTQTVTYNTAWSTISGVTRSNYNLKGWATTASATSAAYTAGVSQGNWTKNANLTLYAVWSPKTWTVTYKPGSGALETITYTATKTYGQKLTLRGATYTKPGYTQDGWSTAQNSSTKNYALSLTTYNVNSNATLYPYWKANASHTVTLDPNGGTFEDGTTTKTLTVLNGGYYGTFPTVTKGTESLKGWTSDGTIVTSQSISKSEDETLVAKWLDLPVVLVKYEGGKLKYLITGTDPQTGNTIAYTKGIK